MSYHFIIRPASLHLFHSLLPGRLWICCLTCSVQTESRSLSMDTVSKLHTGTPVKETSSLQSLFVVNSFPRILARLCLQLRRNLCEVPAKHLALWKWLSFCRWASCSDMASVLWETKRQERQNKEEQDPKRKTRGMLVCNVKYVQLKIQKCWYKQYTILCTILGDKDVKFFLWMPLQMKKVHPLTSVNALRKCHLLGYVPYVCFSPNGTAKAHVQTVSFSGGN